MANYSYTHKFKFLFKTQEFLGQDFHINIISSPVPDISIGTITQPTPYKNIDWAGDSANISDITVTFLVAEDLIEWKYMFKWLNLIKECKGENIDNYETDGVMVLTTAKQNELYAIQYEGMFPYQLSQLNYTTQVDGMELIKMSASFKVKNIKVYDQNDSDFDGTRLVT